MFANFAITYTVQVTMELVPVYESSLSDCERSSGSGAKIAMSNQQRGSYPIIAE